MLLYEVQDCDVSLHAMLEYIQQPGFTYEMPAPYKLACTHRHETHWHREAGINCPSLVHRSRKARQRRAFLLVNSKVHNTLFNIAQYKTLPLHHLPLPSSSPWRRPEHSDRNVGKTNLSFTRWNQRTQPFLMTTPVEKPALNSYPTTNAKIPY